MLKVVGVVGYKDNGKTTLTRALARELMGRDYQLPNPDCGACGHERCYDMACEIVAGTGSIEDCASL